MRFPSALMLCTLLVVAVAATDLAALYEFLTGGGVDRSVGIEVTPILTTVKRTGLVRAGV